VCLHGCVVTCASCTTKQTFGQCRSFLEGTLGIAPFPFQKKETGPEVPFHNSIIGYFMVYQDRLETNLLQPPRKFTIVFDNLCYYFWGKPCWWTETNIIGNDCFVFHKLPLRLNSFTAPPPFRCSGVPVSPPSRFTYNGHIIKNESSCILYAHSQFLCSLASFKLSTLGIRHRSQIPSLIIYYSTRHSRSLMFLQLWTAVS